MKTILTEQQASFFTKNGSIEFAMPHERLPESMERDPSRKDPKLRDFLIRKLGPIALRLTGKNRLILALDQIVAAENRPKTRCVLKEMISIQGIAIGVAMADNPEILVRRSPLGIVPLPNPGHILFFRPDLILDWPHAASSVYLALFGLPNAVYVHNPKDPSTHFLKSLGYHFGDLLKNETHPLIL